MDNQNQAATGMSIDTKEFRDLLHAVWRANSVSIAEERTNNLIAHIDAHTADLRAQLARQGQGTPVYQTMEGEFGEYWSDTDKAGFDAANAEGIATRIVYLAPPAPASAQTAELIELLKAIRPKDAADLQKPHRDAQVAAPHHSAESAGGGK